MEVSKVLEKSILHDWIENETHALDVVASWETLCETYRILEFVDPISDTVKMEEFKWIIREMNKHLTRARKKLLTCKDIQTTRTALEEMFKPSGDVTISCRSDLAYQKLRQRWITQMLARLDMMEETLMEIMEEENG